ncbi:MAG TPA: hypothetical protein VFG30_27035 [Polyangiales bacterium]|nr:hypothetical protein [Polyangiales bacterium]
MNLAFEWLPEERVIVLYQGLHEALDSEWDGYLESLTRFHGTHPGGILVYTEGGRPTRDQQQRLMNVPPLGWPIAVVSPSTAVRFVVSVFALELPAIQLFAPEQMEQAFAFLGCGPDVIPAIRAAIDRCKLVLAPAEQSADVPNRLRGGTGPVRTGTGPLPTVTRLNRTDRSISPGRRNGNS